MHTMGRLVRRSTHNVLHQVSHQLQDLVFEKENEAQTVGAETDVFARRPPLRISGSSTGVSTPSHARCVSWSDEGQPGLQSPFLREACTAFSRSAPSSTTDLHRLAESSSEATAPLSRSLPGSMTDLKRAAETNDATAVAERPRSRARRTQEAPSGAVFSHQGDQLLSVGLSGELRLWDLTDPAQYLELKGMPETAVPVRCSFSPDDSMVLATPSLTDVLYVWDLESGMPDEPYVLQAPSRVLGECFSRDGARIAVTCADTVAVWSCTDLRAEPILLPRGD